MVTHEPILPRTRERVIVLRDGQVESDEPRDKFVAQAAGRRRGDL